MWYKFKRILIRILYSYIIRDSVKCAKKLGVSIGERCLILDDAGSVFGSEPWLVTVGNHVEITNGVRFITHEGALWCLREMYPELRNGDIFNPIHIGNNVMIGMQSIIMPGVSIGNNVVIGANSVVTKSIPDNTIVAGVPAKAISTIEAFAEKVIHSSDLMNTKSMTHPEKYTYIKKERPEWFAN